MRKNGVASGASNGAFGVVAPVVRVGLGLGVVVLLPVRLLVLGLITEGCGPPS